MGWVVWLVAKKSLKHDVTKWTYWHYTAANEKYYWAKLLRFFVWKSCVQTSLALQQSTQSYRYSIQMLCKPDNIQWHFVVLLWTHNAHTYCCSQIYMPRKNVARDIYVCMQKVSGFKLIQDGIRGATQNFREFECTAQTVSTTNLRH